LVDYNTLQKVVEFVQDSLAELSQTTLEAVPANETAVQGEQTTPAPATLPASTTTPHAPAEEEIKTFLLNLVSEKTGYPLEILEMDLDLEADLGIDTVKQAELFSAVREHYSIPKQEDLMLVDYNTLQKVVEFVQKALEGTSHTSTTQTTPGIEQPAQVEQPSPDPKPTPKRVSNADLPNEEEIKTFLLNLVSEKTGYPPEILEMDLDLEADLGIDTVKQAELFSAVREHYSIPKQEDLMLVDYNTLQKVVEFVQDSLTTPAENTATSAQTYTEVALAEPVEDEQADENRQTIARRVPRPMLLPRTTLCLPTGIQLNEDSRVLVFDDAQGSSDALVHLLIERQVQVLKLTTADLTDISETIQLWLSQGPIHGVYFLPGIGDETPLAAMTADEWDAQLEQTTVALYHIMKALPEEAFLMTATKTGGLHGYTKEKVIFTGSGISGFTKAIKLERPKSLAKVVDFSPKENAATIATQLIEETLHDPSVVEVGLENGQRFGIIVIEQPWSQSNPRSLEQGSVFLVTGGTGGITLPIVQDLANHTQGRFYLTGRSPLPKTDSPDLATLRATGPEGLEQAWMKRLQESGQKFTPLEVRSKVERFVRATTTLEAIEAIQQSGASVEYIVADITSQEDMERVAQDVLEAAGQVDVLIHAAGFERSRKLSKKPLEEFLQTIHVKASGFFYLYQSLRSRNALPKEMVLFSSVAGRFGNNGQTDYSAANDLLSKMGIVIQSQHPGTRVTTIDWGPWAEVGMASRGSTPRLMAFAGIEMLSPDTAAGLVFKEIVQAGGGEVIYAGTLGILEEQLGSENSLDLPAANRALQSGNPPQLMLSKITGFNRQEGATFEVTLDPSEEPFLHDHAVNGTPLLPGVMGIEGFSSVAQHIVNALSANGPTGLQVTELENVEFANPFKFYRNEPRHIIWKTFPIRGSRGLEVQVTMESLNPSRLEQYPKPIQHFTGTVHLTTRSNTSNGLFAPPPKWNGRYTLSEEKIYQLYFHGPSFQVVAGVQRDQNGLLAKFRSDLPPITTQTLSLGTTPLLIELCLQTAGIWEIGQTGEMSLPRGIQKVKLYNHEVNGEAVFAKIQPVQTPNGILFNSQVLDSTGKVYLELQGYRTATLPAPMDPTLLEPIRKLLSEE
ncbi:SDR family NAD(P)-dependent oxidoreductase, partial [bacterium]|nr:SDR family NAD(P)-dependent oxidoreductase [bacterium]